MQTNKENEELTCPLPLWHLELTKLGEEKLNSMNWWDCADQFIVAARTMESARRLAQDNGGDETYLPLQDQFPFWSDPKQTTVKLLAAVSNVTEEKVVLRSFNAA
tara:strand:+ start:261 stop:575 length:315 start_codon:yes stop_codon:yes gene_type:complete